MEPHRGGWWALGQGHCQVYGSWQQEATPLVNNHLLSEVAGSTPAVGRGNHCFQLLTTKAIICKFLAWQTRTWPLEGTLWA